MAPKLWETAKSDLWVPTEGSIRDPVVWEHSARVAHLAHRISALPEVANRVLDHTALTAAALYHDAGWILQVQAGQIKAGELLSRRTSDEQRAQAAYWVTERLAGLISPGGIQLTARIIRSCNDRSTSLIEAQILAEAENLDSIGPQVIWLLARRQLMDGRSLSDTIAAWRRQEEYHYWPAWIRECFRFPSARSLAEERLEAMRRLMADLQQACQDLGPAIEADSSAKAP